MTLFEFLFFAMLIIIAWPLIQRFFRALGFLAASYFCKMRYPVEYTDDNGEKKTFYLTTVSDVREFVENPKPVIERYKGLHH